MHKTSVVKFAFNRQTWLIPLILVLGLAVLFPAIYLTSTVNPQGHLRDLPIGLVVEEQSPSVGATDAAEKLSAAIAAHVDRAKIDLISLSAKQLKSRIANDRIAGAIIIPSNFNSSISSLFPGAPPAALTVPTVQIRTNAGDGGISSGLVTGNLTPLLSAVQHAFGQQLLPIAESGGASLSGAEKYVLESPYTIVSTPYLALPANSGFGTSALYYTLVLVLLGFVGASVINPFVDSALGFVPSEVGPIVARRTYLKLSRLQTLLVKFGIIVAAAPVAAFLVQWLATSLAGVSIGDPVTLWLFSSASIAAIGISALTVFAIFGSGIGSLVNTLFFIALSMSSSGGTVPLAATPPFYQWLSTFEPFHPIIEGVRSILYFDGNSGAGLSDGWIRIAIGAAIGIVLGLAATTLYGRTSKFSRDPLVTTTAIRAL
jgi:uncharacterized phage infection (PIP) family protein YhgE